jgi:2-aminoadipate transaminase
MSEVIFADRLQNLSGSIIREILKLTAQPDIISFAGGMPAPGTFPVKELQEAAVEAFTEFGPQMLQYGATEGYVPLRQWIADWLSKKGIKATVDNTLLISGSQQGLDLAVKAFINKGDTMFLENPTFLGAVQTFNTYEANLVAIDCDEHGMKMDALEKALQEQQPKLLYSIPTFQNPSGNTLPLERRKKLVELAAKYNFFIIEDDPYGWLRYHGEELPTLKALDKADKVIYLGSSSKIVAPGARVGWAIAQPDILRKMVIGKQAADVHTSNLSQYTLYNYLKRNVLDEHIAHICEEYRAKCDFMLEVMGKYFPKEATWNAPEGGLFIWITLPAGYNTTKILEEAVKDKVAFVPGSPFYVHGGGENTLRLNFSNSSMEQIETGIKKLGEVLAKTAV